MSSCRCQQAGFANRKLPTAASASTRLSSGEPHRIRTEARIPDSGFGLWLFERAKLSDDRFLIAHHFPVTVAIRPKFADEDPPKECGGASWESHGAFIGDESVVRSKLLHLEKLKRIFHKHAVL